MRSGGGPSLDGIRVLLIEDDEGYSKLVRTLLRSDEPGPGGAPFALTGVSRLSDGLATLSLRPIDVVLLDLGLPDSAGLQTLSRVRRQAPNMAVVVLTGQADERLALEALHEGAQDYLIKTETNADTLVRSVRYAIERQRLVDALENLSLVDHLTGLYNRRGFFSLAERQLAQCRRRQRPLALLLADLDGLKEINDRYGHQEGDRAIALVGEYLKRVSRGTDIAARLGGDEFAILLADGDEDSARKLQARLEEPLPHFSRWSCASYRVTVSVGVACGAAEGEAPLEDLMAAADARMYRHKRRGRGGPRRQPT